MSSKDKILQAIKFADVPASALPENIPDFSSGTLKSQQSLVQLFSANLHKISGTSILVKDHNSLINDFLKRFKDVDNILNTVSNLSLGDTLLENIQKPHELETINVAIVKGAFGVAENGAVWIDEKQLGFRVIPFICQHLVLVLDIQDIVENLHIAYKNRKELETGYGVFIAGPSKTADIEQSLVIGAHGARSITVYVLNEENQES